MAVDDDLATRRQLHATALEPGGVGHQADLHEHARQVDAVQLAALAVLVGQAHHLAAVALDLGGLRIHQHLDVGQAVQLALQHRVGAQLAVEFQQRHVVHHAGQVDGRLDARVAAADHGHLLALEQRAVAVRAVGHALGAVLGFARHVHVAPAGAGGQDHALALERAAAGQRHFHQVAVELQGLGALHVHDVHVVRLDVLFQRHGELRAVGFLDGDVVLDAQRVQHLAAEALGRHTGADALARRIHGRRRAGRAAADDQHVERCLGAELCRVTGGGAGVDLGQDLFQAHAALAEGLAVQEDRRHGHDLALLDLVLEEAAVDGHVLDARVQHRHQVQRLHHVRAVVAGQAHPGLEDQVLLGLQRADLLDQVGFHLGRVAAGLQQRQHQRGELVAHRQRGKAHAHVRALAGDLEGGAAAVGAVGAQRDLVGQADDLAQQLTHLLRFGAVVQRGDQFDRLLQAFEVALELGLEVGVQHGGSFSQRYTVFSNGRRQTQTRLNTPRCMSRGTFSTGPGSGLRKPAVPACAGSLVGRHGAGLQLRHRWCVRSCRPGPATGSGWQRLRSTWRGTPGPGGRRCTGQPSACAAFP